jgi:hypothetical protein
MVWRGRARKGAVGHGQVWLGEGGGNGPGRGQSRRLAGFAPAVLGRCPSGPPARLGASTGRLNGLGERGQMGARQGRRKGELPFFGGHREGRRSGRLGVI